MGDLLDRMVTVEEGLHLLRRRVELVDDELDLLLGDRPLHLGELQCEQVDERNLGGKRLGGGDAHLEPVRVRASRPRA